MQCRFFTCNLFRFSAKVKQLPGFTSTYGYSISQYSNFSSIFLICCLIYCRERVSTNKYCCCPLKLPNMSTMSQQFLFVAYCRTYALKHRQCIHAWRLWDTLAYGTSQDISPAFFTNQGSATVYIAPICFRFPAQSIDSSSIGWKCEFPFEHVEWFAVSS